MSNGLDMKSAWEPRCQGYLPFLSTIEMFALHVCIALSHWWLMTLQHSALHAEVTHSAHSTYFTVSSHSRVTSLLLFTHTVLELIIMSYNAADAEYVVEVCSVVPVTWKRFRNDTLWNVQLKNCAYFWLYFFFCEEIQTSEWFYRVINIYTSEKSYKGWSYLSTFAHFNHSKLTCANLHETEVSVYDIKWPLHCIGSVIWHQYK